MLHIFLAFYILCFTLGVVVTILSFLASGRSGIIVFRQFGVLFCAVLLLLLCDTLKIYEKTTPERVFGSSLPAITLGLTVAGNGLLAYATCLLAVEIVELPIGPGRTAVHILFIIASIAAGAVKEIFHRFPLSSLNEIALIGLLAYAVVVMLVHFDRISHPRLRSLVQSVMLMSAIMLLAVALQLIGEAESPSLRFLSDFPVVRLLYFMAMAGLLLFYSLRYLLVQEQISTFELPEEVALKYGISPREREIISMMVQGYPNRTIGEKLFISSTTVKNHIYHIYQKTGATNKVQLINLMNSPK